MKIGVFLNCTGHHAAGWRHPDAVNGANDFSFYVKLAELAEQGKLDMIFLSDDMAFSEKSHPATTATFEPFTLLSALSVVTKHIGLAMTATTTYNEPFHIARKLASLDHLSGGRAAWNVVTSSTIAEAFNFNRDEHMEHGLRYERAEEFLQVAKGLWDSWEADALLLDKAKGVYYDKAKVHLLSHKGKHFSVRGPLNVSRSPQGYPVIVQAGSSEMGQELAAKSAEVVFTAQPFIEGAQAFYAELKGRLAAYGRTADELKIMPGLMPIIGRTEQEARDKYDALQSLIPEETGLGILSLYLGTDLSGYPLDEPLPELPEAKGLKSRQRLILDIANKEQLTVRQLYKRIASAKSHAVMVGTAKQIADQMERWVKQGAADGFNIMPPYFPGGLEDFVNQVIPELQRRGSFKTEYKGKTLRENLALNE